tara:strand:- start:240 stop:428 length:189 start_codon:yes stop_codon:yes gene_type:complete
MPVTKQTSAGLYDLVLRSVNEVIDRIYAPTVEDARSIYILRKQMNEKDFDKLFDVKHTRQRK